MKRYRRWQRLVCCLGILVVLTGNTGIAQQTSTGEFRGRVIDASGDPLELAAIHLADTHHGTTTGFDGTFSVRVRAGTYVVRISLLGYATASDTIRIAAGATLERTYTLEATYLEIGSIVVYAPDDLKSRSLQTSTIITSGEIQHQAASSLGNLLQLIPGNSTQNPTLTSPEQATIRGGDALGSQVIVNGIPLSNNANLQVGIGANTANRGLDLRAIPAENIERIEVIRGIPSVQYGDLTDGIIKVETISRPEPIRLKVTYNPNISEGNLSGGIRFNNSGWVLNANVNVAQARQDIRMDGDGYTRFSGQLNLRRNVGNTDIRHSLFATRSLDERAEQPGYALRQAWYNRDLNLRYSGTLRLQHQGSSTTNASWSVNHVRQNSYQQRLISRDNMVITDLTSEGVREGTIVFGSYLGREWIKGSVYNLYADVHHQFGLQTGSVYHRFLAGASWRTDMNVGEGIIFAPLFPPSLSNPTPRLRRYDEIPPAHVLSLYAEDRLSGRFVLPWQLHLGARYEVYRPEGLNTGFFSGKGTLIGSYNGSFLNPRVNLSVELHEQTRLRFGYGKTSKSPPMGMVFAQDRYYDIVDTVAVVDPLNPAANFSIISTYVRPSGNARMKGYTQDKAEISLDVDIRAVRTSLTAWTNRSAGMFRTFNEPTLFFRRSYPNWPSTEGATIKDVLLDDFPAYVNDGWHEAQGIEFTLRTERIPRLGTAFRMDGAWQRSRRGTEAGIQYGSSRFSATEGALIRPIFTTQETYRDDLLFNYRADVQSRELGLWLTIHLEHAVFNIDGRSGLTDTLAVGFFSAALGTVFIPESDRANAEYTVLRRRYEPFELRDEERRHRFLLNLNVSKTITPSSQVTFFVNNVFNHRPRYRIRRRADNFASFERMNPPIFYGIEYAVTF
jgi:outer membrane receptor protein involved in Fe transport